MTQISSKKKKVKCAVVNVQVSQSFSFTVLVQGCDVGGHGSVYVGVVNDKVGAVLWRGYASLEPAIAAYAHKMPRPHQQDSVRVANGGFGQWLWQQHHHGNCGRLLGGMRGWQNHTIIATSYLCTCIFELSHPLSTPVAHSSVTDEDGL